MGSAQMSTSQVDFLDCSPHNENLFLTGDNEEINFWDFRNYSKSLFSVRSVNCFKVEFSQVTPDLIMVSKELAIEYLSLSEFKPNEPGEGSGVKVV